MFRKRILSLTLLVLIIFAGLLPQTILAGDTGLKEIVLQGEENLYINAGGAEIIFDESSDKIYLSEELKVRREGDDLYISSPLQTGLFDLFKKNKYKIVIGTARDYAMIDIDAGGVKASGVVYADEIYFDAGGIDIELDIYAEKVSVDGGGIDLRGLISAKHLSLNGAGMNVSLEVDGIEEIDLNGAGMDVSIKYLDAWTGIRHIYMDGVGGNLRLLVPSDNNSLEDGQLDVDTNGMIDINVDYY